MPPLDTWVAVMLIYGTLMNPTLFLPLAFREQFNTTRVYQAVTITSFVATSLGLAPAALH